MTLEQLKAWAEEYTSQLSEDDNAVGLAVAYKFLSRINQVDPPNTQSWVQRVEGEYQELIEVIDYCLDVAESNKSWEVKYDIVFRANKEQVQPLLSKLGTRLEWYDPDSSSQEDVMAYAEALERLKKSLTGER